MGDETRLSLEVPSKDQVTDLIKAVNAFQSVVRSLLVEGLDYGVIGGTSNPTLLKAGAEKIIKILGLADTYEFVDRQELFDKPFFRYLIRCRLFKVGTDILVTEGFGECNSNEPKYRYRWVFQSDLPEAYAGDAGKPLRDKMPHRTVHLSAGRDAKQYRIDNDEAAGIVNTILKMARKRALVDAALTAGRLSELFTQDVEDLPAIDDKPPELSKVEAPPAPVTKAAPVEPPLEVMLKTLKVYNPDKYSDSRLLSMINKRFNSDYFVLEDALSGLTPEQLAGLTKAVRVTYSASIDKAE